MELKRKHRAKLRNWLGVGCALALVWGGVPAYAQTSAPVSAPSSSPSAKTTKAKPESTAETSSAKTGVKSTGNPTASHTGNTSPHSSPATHTKSTTASASHKGKSTHASLRKGSKKKTARGQQKIDAERAQAIQQALIREHYLSGEPAGTWNQSSEDAMRRYQADHGWQSKQVPDARALISLGLGPSHDHLLNPESAMTSGPAAPRAAALTPASHSADPGAQMKTSPAPVADSGRAASSNSEATHPQ